MKNKWISLCAKTSENCKDTKKTWQFQKSPRFLDKVGHGRPINAKREFSKKILAEMKNTSM